MLLFPLNFCDGEGGPYIVNIVFLHFSVFFLPKHRDMHYQKTHLIPADQDYLSTPCWTKFATLSVQLGCQGVQHKQHRAGGMAIFDGAEKG